MSGVAFALPSRLGDLDEDGRASILDMVKLVNHINGRIALRKDFLPFADLTQDGFINELDVTYLINATLAITSLPEVPLTRVIETSPVHSESNIAVRRETIIYFSLPLHENTIISTTDLTADFSGKPLLSRVELSSDRRKVTLFYLEPLPSSSRIRVTFKADGIQDFLGRSIDADFDGVPGGTLSLSFDTLSNSPVVRTAMIGRVYASERNSDGANRPLEGVTITVDGAEESLRAVTDSDGRFHLEPVPAGRFFVHVDGRTAKGSTWPNGSYYAFVGKAWEAVAGKVDNLAGETGEIFLPFISSGTLQTVSATESSTITFDPAVIQQNPGLAGVTITVPPGSLFSDEGTRGGKVGIAPVAPDRLPEKLPPGLAFPLVITVQTDGPSNFDTPVPVRFPNLPDPKTGQRLLPGAKSALWSFNHDTGEWEIVGPVTVSPDGNYVETDSGVGIRQPGWHGTQPGSQGWRPPRCRMACVGGVRG